jgi:glycerol-3-phosphate dehydrogenase
MGLKIYDLLAGRYGFSPSRRLTKEETIERLPTIKRDGLRGGVVYYDGQFDDARLLVHLARTAADRGAVLVNYAEVTGLSRDASGYVTGVEARDALSGRSLGAAARVVINATGAFCDGVRRLADPGAEAMIAPSQGVHLVFDRSFLPGDNAIMVPHTSDGRVLFAIPWHGRTVVGTTDTPVDDVAIEPRPFDHEIDFILETAATYLARPPRREDVRAVFTGIRPLVKASSGSGKGNTAALSRDHTIHIDPSGLLTIAGGKWTTYRNMAEDAVDQAATLGELPDRACVTKTLRIHGHDENAERHGPLSVHGSDAPKVREIGRGEKLHARLPYTEGEVVFAAREEMAMTVEDVLARRTRALFLDAKAALECAPRVASILATELGRDAKWERAQVASFRETAGAYVLE